MYVVVVGAGMVGYYLTRTLLAEGHEVALVEKDRHRAESLAEEFGEVVVRGDGCEVRTLEEIGTGRADVLVATTGHDEDNLIMCQMAKRQFEVPRCVARINNPRNEDVFRTLGVEITVNATRIIYSLIEQEVDTGEVIPLTTLKRGDIEIVEADLTAASPVVSKLLREVHLPGDSVIAAIVRHNQIILPSPTTKLEVQDCVIALTRPQDEHALRVELAGASKPPRDAAAPNGKEV